MFIHVCVFSCTVLVCNCWSLQYRYLTVNDKNASHRSSQYMTSMYIIEDRPTTDLASWKISNGHISVTGRPIHFISGSRVLRVGFSGSVDRMALHPIGPNPRSRPSAVWYNFEWPYLWNGSSDPIRVWFYGKSIEEDNARGEEWLDWSQHKTFLVIIIHVTQTSSPVNVVCVM